MTPQTSPHPPLLFLLTTFVVLITTYFALPPPIPSSMSTVSPSRRVRFVMTRLAGYTGAGRGFARISHVVVSLVGILGMFAAIVGALLGPWMADTAEDVMDDDRFSYWANEEEEGCCGYAREEKYAMLRLVEGL